MNRIKIIKIMIRLALIIFIIFILYLMFVEPYTKNGNHMITMEECQETYNCDCTYDNGKTCLCTLKKWLIEKEYSCSREIIEDSQIIKE